MKVLLVNGSPRIDGCTNRALEEIEKILKEEGITCEKVHIGGKEIRGCIACNTCKEKKKCVFDDIVNTLATKFETADGIIIGTPVYYAGSNGSLISLLDRLFYSTQFDKTMKVGGAVISSRRAGSTSALDEIYKYYGISNMPIVTSTYWNEVHGFTKEDVEKDEEGLETMKNLGRNMAFMIKAIALGKEKYSLPKKEKEKFTSFPDGL